MTKLSTESQSQEFVNDLYRIVSEFDKMARDLPHRHQYVLQSVMYGNDIYRKMPPELPDTSGFFTGFSMLLPPLYQIVQSMIELEDELDDSEDEQDHVLGEIFTLKKTYLNITDSVVLLETSRVQATAKGFDAREFFHMVSRVEGIPSGESLSDRPLQRQWNPATTNATNFLTQQVSFPSI